MDQPNYHHLWHFFMVAQAGGLRLAAEKLYISASTLSEQIKALEKSMDGALFDRSGRHMRLTEFGQHVYGYAQSIFSTGRELMESMHDGSFDARVSLRIGIVNVMPKVVAYRLLAPLMEMESPPRLTVKEDESPRLLTALANDELDVVLSDTPVAPQYAVRASDFFIGASQIAIYGTTALMKSAKKQTFPECLQDMPMLMPTEGTVLAFELDRWFEEVGIQPVVVARFENSGLIKLFGSQGYGLFAAPLVAHQYIEKQYGCCKLGIVADAREPYYAITTSRSAHHPGVAMIKSSVEALVKEDKEWCTSL